MFSISLSRSTALSTLMLAGFSVMASSAQTPPETAAQRSSIASSYGKLPLTFEVNRGQTDRRVRFLARGSGYGVFLTPQEAVLALHAPDSGDTSKPAGRHLPSSTKTDVLRMRLLGGNGSAEPHGADPLAGTVNYFRGNDPSHWQSGVSTFAKVEFAGVYPGVELVYYGNQQQLEYDFVVAPKASPEAIRLQFAGAGKIQLAADGDLTVRARNGMVVFHAPTVYQNDEGRRRRVSGRFRLLAHNSVGFALGDYDHDRPLIIDPVLVYSTYLGGSRNDEAVAIAVDSSGFAYIAGTTESADFPVTSGAIQTTGAAGHIDTPFVTKLNKDGTALVYSTFLSGTSSDVAYALAVDGSGNAYVAGLASSLDFPVTPGAFQTTNVGKRAFVTKLNSTGTALVYSTYLGGNGGIDSNHVNAIAVDASGSAYVAGVTNSSTFPTTPGAFQTSNNTPTHTAFVAKLHPDGSSLDYATYLGGSGQDEAKGIALGAHGNAYVAGFTSSKDFPVTSGAFQNKQNSATDSNGFVTKLNAAGTALVYSTYLGGSVQDEAYAIALDKSENAWVTGYSASSDFPVTSGAFQSSQGAVFVSSLNADGASLGYSTFLGEPEAIGQPRGNAIAVGQSGDIFVAGSAGPNFPVTPGAFQSTGWAGASGFVTRLNAAGTALVTSTYLGGSVGAFVYALAIDANGNAFVAGQTTSTDFPISTGAFQTTKKTGRFDGTGFVTKLDTNAATIGTTTTLTSSINPAAVGQKVIFDAAVDATSGSTTPTGNVVFNIDSTDVATVALSAGAASYQTTSLTSGSHTVKATYAGDAQFSSSSDTLTETVQLPQTAAPTFSPTPGVYIGAQSITISDSTAGSSIYYTANGSTPSSSSTLYTGPITVAATTTIKALATAPNHTTSAIASATYTIQIPGASISPATLSFGNQTAGTTSAGQVVTLRNTGSGALSITGITITGTNPTEFSQTNNCGTSLAAGSSCAISVTFTPASAASYSAALSIADNAPGSPQTAGLSGTGIAVVQGDFTVSADPPFAAVAAGTDAQFYITVGTTAGSFNKSVSLTAAGLPPGSIATFVPASLTPGSGTAASALTIRTAAPAANRSLKQLWPMASPVLALFVFAFPRRQRRKWSTQTRLLLLALASLGAATAVTGCGRSFTQPQSSVTSIITITATSGSDVHTTTVQLTVN